MLHVVMRYMSCHVFFSAMIYVSCSHAYDLHMLHMTFDLDSMLSCSWFMSGSIYQDHALLLSCCEDAKVFDRNILYSTT
jgi:hypothetical protein